jgi:FkbM family methyltransferase
MENLFNEYLAENGESSYSQNNQDKLVLFLLGESPGFFVEFGADDGVTLSNSFALEKMFHWNGIVCEPSIVSREKLIDSRTCQIDFNCVTDKSGEAVSFIETGRGLSSMEKYAYDDMWAETRKKGYAYEVPTISLLDLLNKYNAPDVIDYLSIDTEGSELDILTAYDFSKTFKVITVEHNYTKNRDRIYNLLASKGYIRIMENLSKWDDWYVHKSVPTLTKTNDIINLG